MPFANNFAANLEAAIRSRGMTQAELARKSKVHPVTINRIIKRVFEPSVTMIERLSKAAQMDPQEIFSHPKKSA